MKQLFTLIGLGLGLTSATAQAKLTDVIAEATHIIHEDLSGPGWELLLTESQAVDYFMVGEDHGIRQVPEICTALYQTLSKEGYDHVVLETGPFTANILNGWITEPQRAAAFHQQYPFAVPFYNKRMEFSFLTQVARLSKSPAPLWGIDQELMGSPRLLLDHFRHEFTNETLIEEQLKLAKAGYQGVLENQNFAGLWMISADKSQLSALKEAAGSATAIQLVEELAASQKIYAHYNSGNGYLNNLDRAALMKEHWAQYRSTQPTGKVFFKMGANHVMRGYSFTNIQDIGNTISELPGKGSFHLAILPAGGHQNVFIPFLGEESKNSPVDLEALEPIMEYLGEMPEAGYLLVDLRPLRKYARGLAEKPALVKLIQGFDALLILPNALPDSDY